MKLTYDSNQNIAYITLREGKREEVETIQISDELNIDIASYGKIYGIELLNANEQLRNNGSNNIRVVNEITGKEVMLDLNM